MCIDVFSLLFAFCMELFMMFRLLVSDVFLFNLLCFLLHVPCLVEGMVPRCRPLLFELGGFVICVWLLVQEHQCVSLVFNATCVIHV